MKKDQKKERVSKPKRGKRAALFLLALFIVLLIAAALLLPYGGVLNHYFGFDISAKVPALSFLSLGTQKTDVHTHTYGEWEVATEPTCGTDGLARRHCACGAVEARTLFATDTHSYDDATHTCTVCGAKTRSPYAGRIVTFGEYPQTLKAANVNITNTQDARGYYLGSDGAYYAKVTAAAYVHRSIYGGTGAGFNSVALFSGGSQIVYGQVYYFKVEPIRWRVLSEENGTALLLCETVLDSVPFDTSSPITSTYAISTIYNWLTNNFKNTAFSEAEQAKLLPTMLSNSTDVFAPDAKAEESAPFADTVFFLSYADMLNSYYGFSEYPDRDDAERTKAAGDYARARGVYYENNTGNGLWWLRTPRSNSTSIAAADVVNTRGNTNVAAVVSNAFVGVAPAVSVKLTDIGLR